MRDVGPHGLFRPCALRFHKRQDRGDFVRLRRSRERGDIHLLHTLICVRAFQPITRSAHFDACCAMNSLFIIISACDGTVETVRAPIALIGDG